MPEVPAERGKFAELFKRLNDYLAAAKIQGFVWKESVYRFKHEETEDTLVTMIFDERVYGILAMRYKELSSGGTPKPGNPPDVPFDIDPYLTEIDVGQINADYMNTKFQKFVKCLVQENVTSAELDAVREELHKTSGRRDIRWSRRSPTASIAFSNTARGRLTRTTSCSPSIRPYRTMRRKAQVLPDLGEFGNDYKIVGVLRKAL